MTYDSICKKLGFRIEDFNPKIPFYDGDESKSYFAPLTIEELDYLANYIKEHPEIVKMKNVSK